MKKIIFLLLLVLSGKAFSQDSLTRVFAFPAMSNVDIVNDSTIVGIILDAPYSNGMTSRKPCAIMGIYRNAAPDTAQLAKGRYYGKAGRNEHYFLVQPSANKKIQEGDLVYIVIKVPNRPVTHLYKLVQFHTYLTTVNDSLFYDFNNIVTNWDDQKEQQLKEKMVEDIVFTGKAMQEQNDGQGVIIKGGIFDGQPLFDAMQKINVSHLDKFLKYMIARPANYRGHEWKVSEIFATWMVSKTPQVVE
jgi:hypothetical protein